MLPCPSMAHMLHPPQCLSQDIWEWSFLHPHKALRNHIWLQRRILRMGLAHEVPQRDGNPPPPASLKIGGNSCCDPSNAPKRGHISAKSPATGQVQLARQTGGCPGASLMPGDRKILRQSLGCPQHRALPLPRQTKRPGEPSSSGKESWQHLSEVAFSRNRQTFWKRRPRGFTRKKSWGREGTLC